MINLKNIENKILDFYRSLLKLKGKTAITFHINADIDAVSSALLLKSLIKNSVIRSSSNIDSSAKNVLEILGFGLLEFKNPLNLNEFDNIVFVDVSDSNYCGIEEKVIKNFNGKILIIDHHCSSKIIKNSKSLILENYDSCSQIIYELYKISNKKLTKWQAFLISLSILSDTAILMSSNNQSISTLSYLLNQYDIDFQSLLILAKRRADISEKTKVLQSVKNCKFIKTKNHLIAYSFVDSFQLSSATSLISSGADFAFAVDKKRGKLSAVCSNSLAEKGFNVSKILKQLQNIPDSSSGGHSSVAGMNFNYKQADLIVETLIEKSLKLINQLENQ